VKIVFLGTGVAVNVENRAQQSILIDGEKIIMVDCGYGTMLRLGQAGYGVEDIDSMVITHFHLDHCGELMGLLKARWLLNAGKLDIYAPHGCKSFIESFLQSSPYLRGKLKYRLHEVSEGDVFTPSGLKFQARKTVHSMESLGYIVEDVLISGDTSAFPELYEDAEIAVHEMSLSFGGKADFHTSPENFAKNAQNIKKAHLVHLYPPAFSNRGEIKKYLEKKGIKVDFPEDLQILEI